MLKTFFALILSSLATFVFGVVGMVLAVIAPKLVLPVAVRTWGKLVLGSFRVSLKVEGTENIPHEPSVIMYNHQSSFDILALVASLSGDYKMVMKNEVLKIPFVGWVSLMTRHYFVSRDGGSGDSKTLKLMTRGIREKKHTVVLAPEGTRSKDGRLLDFKKGGFLLSSLSGAPVVPVVIWGGKNLKSKSGGKLRTGGEMSVEFFPPVYPGDFPAGREGMDEIEMSVRNTMLQAIDRNFRKEENTSSVPQQ